MYRAKVKCKKDFTLDMPQELLDAVSSYLYRNFRVLKSNGTAWTIYPSRHMHPDFYEVGYLIVQGRATSSGIPFDFGEEVWFTEGLDVYGTCSSPASRPASFISRDKDALDHFLACWKLDLEVEEEKPFHPDSYKGNFPLFMGSGPYSGLACAAVHRLLDEAFSTLCGMQQNGGMGYPFDDELQEKDQRRLVEISGILNRVLLGDPKKPEMEDCPRCHQKTVRAKSIFEGGGVVCTNPKCDYWFCY